jgi:hypothetical protein
MGTFKIYALLGALLELSLHYPPQRFLIMVGPV